MLLTLICLFTCSFHCNTRFLLFLISDRNLNHWCLSAVSLAYIWTDQQVKLQPLTHKFSQSVTSTFTAAAASHFLMFLQQCPPLHLGRSFVLEALNAPGFPVRSRLKFTVWIDTFMVYYTKMMGKLFACNQRLNIDLSWYISTRVATKDSCHNWLFSQIDQSFIKCSVKKV